MSVDDESRTFYPSSFIVVLPKEGGGIREIDHPGQTWKSPDYESEMRRLGAIGVRCSLEFPSTDGEPGCEITTYKDGSQSVFYDGHGERHETIFSADRKSARVVYISRRITT
jgi:hypothetical protein